MRYMMMIKMDESMPAGPPPPSLYAAIGELGEQARKDGTLLEEGGLLPSAAGALVRLSGVGHRRPVHRGQGTDRWLRRLPGAHQG